MVLSIMVPNCSAKGSGGEPPVPPTILMTDSKCTEPDSVSIKVDQSG